jgi:hypothetical protein
VCNGACHRRAGKPPRTTHPPLGQLPADAEADRLQRCARCWPILRLVDHEEAHCLGRQQVQAHLGTPPLAWHLLGMLLLLLVVGLLRGAAAVCELLLLLRARAGGRAWRRQAHGGSGLLPSRRRHVLLGL